MYYDECVQTDHKYSLRHEYNISKAILHGKSGNDDNTSKNKFHNHLSLAYKEIVIPFNRSLRELMIQYNISNEGELYCTTLNFSMADDKFSKIIGDPGKKDEDAVESINSRVKELQAEYVKRFRQLQEEYKAVEATDLAKAVYFSAYYN